MIEIGFVFPGQGSQYVGMGKDLTSYPRANELFDLADQILDRDLKSLCFEGPGEELQETINTQPAIFVVSHIYYELLKSTGVTPDIVAGHSLGEYTALVVSGAIGFEEGLALVAKRAGLMNEVARKASGAMIAVIGLEPLEIKKVIEELAHEGMINVANFNCPGQMVVSGEKELVGKAGRTFEKIGARRVISLQVGGAFHTRIMEKAEQQLCDYLNTVSFDDLSIPLVSNATAEISLSNQVVKEALCRQMTSSVLWQQSIERMLEAGVKTFVEVGPGKVLSGLIRRIARDVTILNVGDDQSFTNVKDKLLSRI